MIKSKHLKAFKPLQRGDRLWTSESDIYRRQIPTSKVYPCTMCTERIKLL